MSTIVNTDKEYLEWVKDVVARYRQSQIKAAVKVNQELLESRKGYRGPES